MIIDDQPMFADALQALLKRDERIEVVAATDNGAHALELASRLEIDVAVVDLAMPGVDGLEITRRLRAEHPSLQVVVVSGLPAETAAGAAIDAGASAFLLKGRLHEDVAEAILGAAGGGPLH